MGTGVIPETEKVMSVSEETQAENGSKAEELEQTPSQGKQSLCDDVLYYKICKTFSIEAQDAKQYSPLTLAYIGDAIYEVIVRTVLVEKGNAPVNTLHKRASKLVKAEAQKNAFFRIKELLSEEEMAVFKRGRNAKSYTSAKNATIGDYRIATGYEALFGYWYLSGQTERMLEMAQAAMEEI